MYAPFVWPAHIRIEYGTIIAWEKSDPADVPTEMSDQDAHDAYCDMLNNPDEGVFTQSFSGTEESYMATIRNLSATHDCIQMQQLYGDSEIVVADVMGFKPEEIIEADMSSVCQSMYEY
jgi:hypothetical protein